MKAKIRGIEVEVDTFEQLDALIERYGGATAAGEQQQKNPAGSSGAGVPSGGVADSVALRRLIEVGTTGMPATELGTILGRQGKATFRAAQEWAVRIGLVQDPNQSAIERCRVGTQRGMRIITGLQEVARELQNHKQK